MSAPDPWWETAKTVDAAPAKPTTSVTAPKAAPRARGSHASRFAFAYFALAVATGTAAGALAVLLLNDGPGKRPAWSDWEPKGSVSAKLFQIVERVGPKYRRADGAQLVSIAIDAPRTTFPGPDGQPLTIPVDRIEYAVRGDVRIANTAATVQFVLCGQDKDCAIGGVPSQNRNLLVHREALELALYALKYIPELEAVTVLLPPAANAAATDPTRATFYRRPDLKPVLERAFTSTFPNTASRLTSVGERETKALAELAGPNTFHANYRQGPDGAVMMVLQPANP